jgi:regulator of replication initiation timing
MSIIDNAKDVATAIHEMKNLELYERVLNLNAGIMDLVEENRRLKADKDELQRKLKLHDDLKFTEPFYYQDGDQTPFCPACFESNKHEGVHVVFESTNPEATYWRCPACKTDYRIPKNRLAPHPRSFDPRGGDSQSWTR